MPSRRHVRDEIERGKQSGILAAMEHHIKYDGSGLSKDQGRLGTDIVSQIITVADVYDALRSMRPYRVPMPRIKSSGF